MDNEFKLLFKMTNKTQQDHSICEKSSQNLKKNTKVKKENKRTD